MSSSVKRELALSRAPATAQSDYFRWLAIMQLVRSAPRRAEAIRSLAALHHIPEGTLRTKFYRFEKYGEAVLLDRRHVPAQWQITAEKTLPRGLIELWRTLCERNQRKCRPAYRQLVRMWETRESALEECYPGFPGWPMLPRGMTYANLMRHRPDKIELTAARIGRSAARRMLPQVHMTRVGIEIGEYYMPDDQDYDVSVAMIGASRKLTRPSGYNMLDLSSGCEIAHAVKPTVLLPDGRKQKLGQLDYEFFLVMVLTTIGYREQGTKIEAEKGTAKASADFEARVRQATGGCVSFGAGGVTRDQLPGLFQGSPRGNPRYKAARESLFNLVRNEMAALPGQIGKDRVHSPEENYGMEQYTRRWLDVVSERPELIDRIRMPVLLWNDFVTVVGDWIRTINSRTDHELEGWADRCVGEWRMDASHPWLPPQSYLALPGPQRGVIDAMIAGNPALSRMRKLSPAEVWDSGKRDLVRISGDMIPVLLGPAAARPLHVTNEHEIVVRDAEISADPMIYDAVLSTDRILKQGQSVRVYLNPFAPDELQVCDPEGRWLGSAPRVQGICRSDTDALRARYARNRAIETRLLAPVAKRGAKLARERIEMHQHNAGLLAEPKARPVTPEQAAAVTEVLRTEIQPEPEAEYTMEQVSALFSTLDDSHE